MPRRRLDSTRRGIGGARRDVSLPPDRRRNAGRGSSILVVDVPAIREHA